jgi:N-methylhydantoinase B
MGTWGASAGGDGQEGVPHIGANQSNVPVEMIEAAYPIRIERYGFVADTGGAGKHRGGLAIERNYRVLSDRALLNVRSDKRAFPPHGLYEGKEGAPSMNILRSGTDARVLPVLLSEPVPMKKGDIFCHQMASGGGYGAAFERDPALVLNDVVQGKVTIGGAERDYGVAIIPADQGYVVDKKKTALLRDAQVPQPLSV